MKEEQDNNLIKESNNKLENKKESQEERKKENKKKNNKKDKKNKISIGKKITRVIVKGAIFAYCKLVYRVKISGTENIPKNGSVIFCGNHRSFLDPPLMEVTCKRDDTRFLAKKELAENKFLAFLGKVFDAILVNRDEKDVGVIKESLKTLKQGNCIAIFPEGTRNGLEKGEKVKDGASYFALNSDAKVIPVGIKGGEKPFKKAYITYGKPIDFDEYKAKRKEKETMDKVTDEIMKNILELAK